MVEESGIKIYVSVEPDKESIGETLADTQKTMQKHKLVIPAELDLPIRNASKELVKAQQDVVKQFSKTFKEGFSSSESDLEDFQRKFIKFKKLAGIEHKNAAKQSKLISEIMGPLVQDYATQKKKLATILENKTKVKEKSTTTNVKAKSDIKKEKVSSKNKRTKDEQRFHKDLKTGASCAKAATPGSPTNLGYRQPNLEGPNVTKKSILDTEFYGPHIIPESAEKERERKQLLKEQKKTLTTRAMTSEDYAYADKVIEQQNRKRQMFKDTLEEDLRSVLLKKLSLVQGGLIRGRNDTSAKDLIEHILAIVAHDFEYHAEFSGTLNRINTFLENRFDSKGSIGVAGVEKVKGEWVETDHAKGEGVNSEYVKKLKKAIYEAITPFANRYLKSNKYIESADAKADAKFGKQSKQHNHTSYYDKAFAQLINSDIFSYLDRLQTIKNRPYREYK